MYLPARELIKEIYGKRESRECIKEAEEIGLRVENKTIFSEIFWNNPIMKVLDFLITFQLFDYPLTEIAKNSGVSYSTLQTFWDKLERNKIVIKTRRVGKSDLYKLNTRNLAVQQLIKLDWNLIKGFEEIYA
jgi:DNA-binding transcriptional ArsR family regulator